LHLISDEKILNKQILQLSASGERGAGSGENVIRFEPRDDSSAMASSEG